MLPIYELKISKDVNDESEVNFVALVDAPAIQRDFVAFKEEFIEPSKGEHKTEFLPRCIAYVVNEGKDSEQAVAICNSIWEQHFAGGISFDYDETLNTERGKQLAKEKIANGYVIYIVSARQDKEGMLSLADELNIPHSRVFATGSNKAKIEKVKELGVSKHYDNNADVIKELGSIGEKFEDTYTDYPQAATENAKIALRWAEENGWGDCGTPVGKIRANQLANREPISKETIGRMAGFERHRQNSDRQLGDGCGRLMWLAWGGDEGIQWASRKLAQLNKEKLSFQITNEEQRVISGPLMIADELIYRNNEQFGEHYVKFSKETIREIAIKMMKKGFQNNVNLMHDANKVVDGVTLFEIWTKDSERGVQSMKGFEDLPEGSLFGSYYVENNEVWNDVKAGKFKGFSVEGLFDYVEPLSNEEKLLKEIERLLNVTPED